jgi:hypothetical protein
MCLFKKELLVTSSIDQKTKVLDILSQHNIKYYLKTKDNFGGGLYSERRLMGSFGMDTSCRFIYHIYVSKKNYKDAIFLLQ